MILIRPRSLDTQNAPDEVDCALLLKIIRVVNVVIGAEIEQVFRSRHDAGRRLHL